MEAGPAYRLKDVPMFPQIGISSQDVVLRYINKQPALSSAHCVGSSSSPEQVTDAISWRWRDMFEEVAAKRLCTICNDMCEGTSWHECGYKHCKSCVDLCLLPKDPQFSPLLNHPSEYRTCCICGNKCSVDAWCNLCHSCLSCCFCRKYPFETLIKRFGSNSPKLKQNVRAHELAPIGDYKGYEISVELAKFYTLNELLARVEVAKQTLNSSVYNILKSSIREHYIPLCKMLAKAIRDSAVQACLGELRHVFQKAYVAQWVSKPEAILLVGFSSMVGDLYEMRIKGMDRTTIYKNMQIYRPDSMMDMCVFLFNNLLWSGGYGGSLWGSIAEACKSYGVVSDVLFIDHMVDLMHNGGSFLSKPTGVACEIGHYVRLMTVKSFDDSFVYSGNLKLLRTLDKRCVEILNLCLSAGVISHIPEHKAVDHGHDYYGVDWGFTPPPFDLSTDVCTKIVKHTSKDLYDIWAVKGRGPYHGSVYGNFVKQFNLGYKEVRLLMDTESASELAHMCHKSLSMMYNARTIAKAHELFTFRQKTLRSVGISSDSKNFWHWLYK